MGEKFSAYERPEFEAKPMPTMAPEFLSDWTDNGVMYNVNAINNILNEVQESLITLRSKMDPILYISPEIKISDSEDNDVKSAVRINSSLSLELQAIRHRVQDIKYTIHKTTEQIDL